MPTTSARQRLLCYFLQLTSLVMAVSAHAQVASCPDNLDFAFGNFSNWECRSGYVSELNGVNTASLFQGGPIAGRHDLISPDSKEVDLYGKFPQHCPNTSSYSVRLGNNEGGKQADALFYTYSIPSSAKNFSILFYYAVVLQNPSHQPAQQPRFRARVMDVEQDKELDCVSFDFLSSGSLPEFKRSTEQSDVFYKDWSPVSVDLSGYAGKKIRLEFISSDCTFEEHFGYAYVSVGSSCNGSISGTYQCSGSNNINLLAPYGYRQYLWYTTNFSNQVGDGQTLTLDASKVRAGMVFPVVVVPYPGYGCQDTLYATLDSAARPLSVAGADQTPCSKVPVQLGGPPQENVRYSWMPATLVSNPTLSNPFVLPGLRQPTEFIIETTDKTSGCSSFDTVLISPVIVDTAVVVSGKQLYCPGETLSTSLFISAADATISWYNGSASLNEYNPRLQPPAPGVYWAQIQQAGCTDTTAPITIAYTSVPVVDFFISKDVQCARQPISFTNRTIAVANSVLRYRWHFSDGEFFPSENVQREFAVPGTYAATLAVTYGDDCRDSVQKQITIVGLCTPLVPTAFTPNGDGKNDRLKPFLAGVKKLKRFTVYNRYGRAVFSTATEGESWDGTKNGQPLQADVFVWLLEYISNDNKTMAEKGTVSLIR